MKNLILNFDKGQADKMKRPSTAKGKKSKLATFTDKPLAGVKKDDFGLDVIQETNSINEDLEDSKLLDQIAFSASKRKSAKQPAVMSAASPSSQMFYQVNADSCINDAQVMPISLSSKKAANADLIESIGIVHEDSD